MRKSTKIIFATATAAILAASTLAAAACAPEIKGVNGLPEHYENVTSNGGFVVGVGNYYYFINGVEQSTADNTYGTPVKGALQRILKSDAEKGENTAETVIPSLMVAGDYTAGLYVFGERIYYATPTNTPNMQGVIENSYLDFKSAKLDGTDITDLFRVDSSSAPYRFVKKGDEVYIVYSTANEENSSAYDLHARKTSAPGTDVVLAENVTKYAFHTSDGSEDDATLYYTMGVVDRPDSDNPNDTIAYNQVYRVNVDATTPVYQYDWDEEWVKDNDGKAPYVNLGELVLDGWGSGQVKTKFTHSESTPQSPVGYTYEIMSFANGGIYFTRALTTGDEGSTYFFLDESKIAEGWDSIAANDTEGVFDRIDIDGSASKLSGAYFYRDAEGGHHYLYADGSLIKRADVIDGETEDTVIARDAASPRFVATDALSHTGENKPAGAAKDLCYVYYTGSTAGGFSVNRAVYNGGKDADGHNDYDDLPFDGEDNSYFTPVRVLDVEHASGWYDFEIVDGLLFFANAKQYSGTAQKYISVVNLKQDGKLMDNKQLKAFNEKLEEVTGTDGLLATISTDASTRLRNLIEYYFYTGDKEFKALNENIQEAEDAKADKLYDDEEIDALKAFANGGEYVYDGTKLFDADALKDGETSYREYSYFVTDIGTHTEADETAVHDHYRSFLEKMPEPDEEEEQTAEPLPGWAIALIVIACVAAAAGAGVGVWFFLKKKKQEAKKAAPKPRRMYVDTTDDKDVDVYSTDEPVPDQEIQEDGGDPDQE